MAWQASERAIQTFLADERAKTQHLKGWRREADGRYAPLHTPAGALARGARVLGHCRKRDGCSRRVELNLRWWCEHGYADTSLRAVQKAFRCGLIGCDLHWEPERFENGIPLQHYASKSGASVLVQCRYCKLERTFTVQQFVDRITAAGTATGNISSRGLHGGLVRGKCPRCGRVNWGVWLATGEP